MSGLPISPVGDSERRRVDATLVSAFVADPVLRWLYPEPLQYLTHFPPFVAALGGKAFETETVWRLGDFGAVALWLPPGAAPDDESIVSVLTASVSSEQHDDLFSVLDKMDATHPSYPHWYLPWFGVDTALHGKGLGGQLMTACLGTVDSDHLPAYLETPNPRNISFYERHGFEVIGEVQAGLCPPLAFMLRAAR